MLYLDIGGKVAMEKIKRIKLFPNYTKESTKKVVKLLETKLKNRGYIIDDKEFDLGIAIGGDGSFLRMVRDCEFNSDVYYVGINTGTLGFAQEIYPNEEAIDEFLGKVSNDEYKIEEVGTMQSKIITHLGSLELNSLNEIIIACGVFDAMHLNVLVNNELLEKFVGDGLLISTSFGSTGQNLSYGGAIVYNQLHTLQITPIGAISSNSYSKLSNSVIMPENKKISIIPDKRNCNLHIKSDGKIIYCNDVERIDASVNNKIKCLRMTNYDYTRRINEKIVKR